MELYSESENRSLISEMSTFYLLYIIFAYQNCAVYVWWRMLEMRTLQNIYHNMSAGLDDCCAKTSKLFNMCSSFLYYLLLVLYHWMKMSTVNSVSLHLNYLRTYGPRLLATTKRTRGLLFRKALLQLVQRSLKWASAQTLVINLSHLLNLQAATPSLLSRLHHPEMPPVCIYVKRSDRAVL